MAWLCIYISKFLISDVQIEAENLSVKRNMNMFQSKGYLIADLFQQYVNDLTIQKTMIETLAKGEITQSPAEPTSRDYY